MSSVFSGLYDIEGRLLGFKGICEQLPKTPPQRINKRLRRGVRTWAALSAPPMPTGLASPWRQFNDVQPFAASKSYAARCTANAAQQAALIESGAMIPTYTAAEAFARWTGTARGRALQLLDINTDPLRASL